MITDAVYGGPQVTANDAFAISSMVGGGVAGPAAGAIGRSVLQLGRAGPGGTKGAVGGTRLGSSGRPEPNDFGKPTAVASDFVPGNQLGHSSAGPGMYSVPNSAGGRVWVSKEPVTQGNFRGLVDKGKAEGPVHVLTGTHGDPNGRLYAESDFLREDYARWNRTDRVHVHDVTRLSSWELHSIVQSSGRTVCAWCYSERSVAILRALEFD